MRCRWLQWLFSAIIGLVLNLFIGISLGANVAIAYAVGQGNLKAVSKLVHTAVFIALVGGIFAAFFGELIAAPLLERLHMPEDVYPLALLYLRIYYSL